MPLLTRGLLLGICLVWATLASAAFDVQNRSIVSSGVTRSFILAVPNPTAANLPLVLSLHGDGGNAASMRAGLPLEAASNDGAIFVYPNAPGGTFEYFSDAGRAREVQFVRDVIELLVTERQIDRTRVFITGFSGGATMANALGCRMEADEIRGLGIHSGSLYAVGNDFTYTANGGVSCALPATILLWGEADNTPGVTYATGVSVRNNHSATQSCASASSAFAPPPCVQYNQCQRSVAWCSIPGMGHSIWNQAASAIWNFFSAQTPVAVNSQTIYVDSLQNGWQNFSWGTVDFAWPQNVYQGAAAVRFNAHSFQGLSFAKTTPIQVNQWPQLRLYIRGDAGAENLNFSLQSGNTVHANVPLNSLMSSALPAGNYREVTVRFADPPINYSGTFERINLQDNTGNAPGNPQRVTVDQVELLAPTAIADFLRDGFE